MKARTSTEIQISEAVGTNGKAGGVKQELFDEVIQRIVEVAVPERWFCLAQLV
jgi:hypothetical protein